MDIVIHDFPKFSDNRYKIERKYCELVNLYRNGTQLDVETLDWMDSANTWLMDTNTK